MKFVNEIVTFGFELLMLVCLSLLLLRLIDNTVLAVIACVVATGVVLVLWGYYFAPRSQSRISLVPGLALTTVMTALGPLVLMAFFPGLAASMVAGLYLVNRVLAIAWKQW